MNSLLEYVQTEMEPEQGKAKLADLVLARREMPDASLLTTGAVPDCMIDETGEINPQRVAILAWIQMRRDQPALTQDEVMGMISLAKGEAFFGFLKRIYWFWSDLSEDEFEQRWSERMRTAELLTTPLEDEEEGEAEEAPENPTPSESS